MGGTAGGGYRTSVSLHTEQKTSFFLHKQTEEKKTHTHPGCWYFIDLDINGHPNSQILLLIDPHPSQHPRVMYLTISDTVTSENTPDAQTLPTNLFLTTK